MIEKTLEYHGTMNLFQTNNTLSKLIAMSRGLTHAADNKGFRYFNRRAMGLSCVRFIHA